MNRRSFLGLLGVGAAGFALDPERLLWRPGEKSYHFISRPFDGFAVGDVLAFNGRTWNLANTRDLVKGYRLGVFNGIGVVDRNVVRVTTDEFYSGMVYGEDRLRLQHKPNAWAGARGSVASRLNNYLLDKSK